MKIAQSTSGLSQNQAKKQTLLPLVPEEEDADAPTKTYTMDTDPGGANGGAKYKMSCRVLDGTESLRTMLNWKKQWDEVVQGLNLMTYGPAV